MNIDEALSSADNMFLGDLTRNAIKESLATAGNIRALYKESQKLLPNNSYHEIWWFLTERCLVRIEITSASTLIRNFLLSTIAYVEREYDITQSSGEYLQTLKTVRIRLVGMTGDLVITRPFENENGDVRNFANLFMLL